MMKHRMIAGLAGLLLLSSSALALRIALPPGAMAARIVTATAAYGGKVTEVSDKAVKAEMFKGDERDMKIATFRVSEKILGKGTREVKIGFITGAGKAGGPITSRGFGPQLTKDMEAVVLLHKHPTMKDVYVFAGYDGLVQKAGNPNFDTEVKAMKENVKAIADPMKGLKSKDAAERLKVATLLVSRYRTAVPGVTKTEDVPAAESKLLLETLEESWDPAKGVRFGEPSSQQAFFQLGLTPADGWTQPKDFKEFPAAAKKWLKENAGKYKMKRFARDEGGPGEEP